MGNKKVLIVEDDADLRLGYRALLKASHYDTVFAEDGLSAVSEARKHQPDLAILDLGLPAGDGFLVMERFSANRYLAHIPVVVVSGRDVFGKLGHRERAIKAGAKAYILKPWDDAELLGTLHELLRDPAPFVPYAG